MIVVILLAILAIVCFLVLLLANDPDWLRSQAEAEVRMHAARRTRELDELKWAMRRDTERMRWEFDAELRELDE